MKKRIISALMVVAMCVSAVPMAVCAESETPDNLGYQDVELLEFTQKFCDEYLINPSECDEASKIIYQKELEVYDFDTTYRTSYEYFKGIYDTFLGISFLPSEEWGEDEYFYHTLEIPENGTKTIKLGSKEIEVAQIITRNPSFICLIDGMPEEEYYKLSLKERIVIANNLKEDSVLWGRIELYYGSFYVDVNGNGYNCNGERIDIVDGKIVTIPDVTIDNVDILNNEKLAGDATEDGKVNLADAVFIMQVLSNPSEYKLTEQGNINADYNGDGGVTTADALEIQMSTIS